MRWSPLIIFYIRSTSELPFWKWVGTLPNDKMVPKRDVSQTREHARMRGHPTRWVHTWLLIGTCDLGLGCSGPALGTGGRPSHPSFWRCWLIVHGSRPPIAANFVSFADSAQSTCVYKWQRAWTRRAAPAISFIPGGVCSDARSRELCSFSHH